MSRTNEGEKLAINANAVLLVSYLFMGACLLSGSIIVLTQPLPYAENLLIMKICMGWIMLPISVFIIGSNIVKLIHRHSVIVIDEKGITDNTDSMGSGFTPWNQISDVHLLKLKDDTFLCAVPTNYDEWVKIRNRRQARLAQANIDMGFSPIRIQFKKAGDHIDARDGLAAVKRFHPEKVSRIQKPKY
ncbi:STM3941 family protein [Olsenella massiliensis]|uniref:STM3941 family protein n=1 Tax=Olsenella massiliensis TaxID=1622075 RepID=UPI00071D87FF|nr:STM3941 family protein [Olsenella massiliensis]